MQIWNLEVFSATVAAFLGGGIVGGMCRHFLGRVEKMDIKALRTILSIIFAGTALATLQKLLGAAHSLTVTIMTYLIGVVVGILVIDVRAKPKKTLPEIAPEVPASNLDAKSASADSSVDNQSACFRVIRMEKVLTFLKRRDGSQAKLERVLILKAVRPSKEFWAGYIDADGAVTLESVTFDGIIGARYEFSQRGQRKELHIFFPVEIIENAEVRVRIVYKLTNAFPNQEERLGHFVDHPTDELSLTVVFLEARPCLDAQIFCRYGGHSSIAKSALERTEQGVRLSTRQANLRIGEEYTIVWKW